MSQIMRKSSTIPVISFFQKNYSRIECKNHVMLYVQKLQQSTGEGKGRQFTLPISGVRRSDAVYNVAGPRVNRHIRNKSYIQSGPKIWHTFCTPYNFLQILTNFQTFLTVRIRRTCVIILSLKIPPHLKCVATLCEMSMS